MPLDRMRYVSVCATLRAIDKEKHSQPGTVTADPQFRTEFNLSSRFTCVAAGGIGALAPLGALTFLKQLFTVDFEVKELGVFRTIVNGPPSTSARKK